RDLVPRARDVPADGGPGDAAPRGRRLAGTRTRAWLLRPGLTGYPRVHLGVVDAAGARVVRAGGEHLGRRPRREAVRGLGDGGSDADPDHADAGELGDARRAWPGHDRDRKRARHQLRDRVEVDQAGHEHAVRAGLSVAGGSLQRLRHAVRDDRVGATQEHVGPGVDPDRCVPGSRAGRRDPVGLRREVVQAAGVPAILQVDADRARPHHRRDGPGCRRPGCRRLARRATRPRRRWWWPPPWPRRPLSRPPRRHPRRWAATTARRPGAGSRTGSRTAQSATTSSWSISVNSTIRSANWPTISSRYAAELVCSSNAAWSAKCSTNSR